MPRKGTGKYLPGWKEFSKKIKDEAGWKCVRCGTPHDPSSGHCLTVHHLTMAKDEPFDNWWAFVALCQRCHLQIQAKVVMHQTWMWPHSEWFRPYVAGYLAHLHGHPTDRMWVEGNLEFLLRLK